MVAKDCTVSSIVVKAGAFDPARNDEQVNKRCALSSAGREGIEGAECARRQKSLVADRAASATAARSASDGVAPGGSLAFNARRNSAPASSSLTATHVAHQNPTDLAPVVMTSIASVSNPLPRAGGSLNRPTERNDGV